MDKSEIDPKILDQLEKLRQKYDVMGQDLSSYLDGLLYANYLNYWDYIHLDTLLSLQNPKTDFPDENIFIIYHQMTELNFKLVLLEMEQIANKPQIKEEFFVARLQRVNRYFQMLTNSFDIMVDGMDKDQFLKFRMSLLPSSGFQSAQYRMIEICATDFKNLVSKEFRDELTPATPVEEMYKNIYWKQGATELATGKKTLTLKKFEEKYSKELIELAAKYRGCNLWAIYKNHFFHSDRKEEIIKELRKFDILVNVNWPLSHFKSAVRYLQKDPEVISATGGTNWQKYLPPRFQLRIFYPELWSKEELKNWGKKFVVMEDLN
ncbi:tryptophan 2,3-dioxygenase family protein [Flexithrix dorotheae]|uniref:tryptophan 2,3-dioxygenase family protein n=1 Tax=Flexithrix dorotheae TaxID=70993 RepID=UPI00035CF962|nr:tryptophan 2,3-dioxygenase family protein [Flexithrix dorotheae]